MKTFHLLYLNIIAFFSIPFFFVGCNFLDIENYYTDELVTFGNVLYKCTEDHTSATEFDATKFKQLNMGYVPVWQAGFEYAKNMICTYGTNIMRALVDHTSSADFTTDRDKWEVIAGKGASIMEWQPTTVYELNETVVYMDTRYRALSAHTSASEFTNDMLPGIEKWKPIGGGGGATGGYKQLTKLNVTAGKSFDIPITATDSFNLPPVEILKFTAGAQNQVLVLCSFDNGDATDFIVDGKPANESEKFIFDGSMRPNTVHTVKMTAPVAFEGGYLSMSEEFIDFSKFKKVVSVSL